MELMGRRLEWEVEIENKERDRSIVETATHHMDLREFEVELTKFVRSQRRKNLKL